VLELVARVLRPQKQPRKQPKKQRWIAAIAAVVLVPSLALAALVVQRASAHPGGTRPAAAPRTQASGEPTLPAVAPFDPSVFQAIASWNWQDGLLPSPSAPLEPMDAFRNQFLNAFGSTPSGAAAAAGGSGAGATAAGSSK